MEGRAPGSVPAPRAAPAPLPLAFRRAEQRAGQPTAPQTPFSAEQNPSWTEYLFDGALGKKKKTLPGFKEQQERVCLLEFLAGCTSRRSGRGCGHQGEAPAAAPGPQPRAVRRLVSLSPPPGVAPQRSAGPQLRARVRLREPRGRRGRAPDKGRALPGPIKPPSLFPGLPISPGSWRPAARCPPAS